MDKKTLSRSLALSVLWCPCPVDFHEGKPLFTAFNTLTHLLSTTSSSERLLADEPTALR